MGPHLSPFSKVFPRCSGEDCWSGLLMYTGFMPPDTMTRRRKNYGSLWLFSGINHMICLRKTKVQWDRKWILGASRVITFLWRVLEGHAIVQFLLFLLFLKGQLLLLFLKGQLPPEVQLFSKQISNHYIHVLPVSVSHRFEGQSICSYEVISDVARFYFSFQKSGC